MSKTYSLKVSFEGDIRRIPITSLSFQDLQNTLRRSVFTHLPPSIHVKYQDADGDWISVTSDLELTEAFTQSSDTTLGKTLHLHLTPNTSHQPMCSFTKCGRAYIRQRYFNCLTCGLTDYDGCCEACVSACHSGHEVVDRGVSSTFFCDCGAGTHDASMCKLAPKIVLGKEIERENSLRRGEEGVEAKQNEQGVPKDERPFAKKMRVLEAVGFDQQSVIAALWKNEGCVEKAVIDLANARQNAKKH